MNSKIRLEDSYNILLFILKNIDLIYIFLQSANIRTIIKARGIEHTNVQGLKTYAIFRADRDHNLISFVSRIGKLVKSESINLCLLNELTKKEGKHYLCF